MPHRDPDCQTVSDLTDEWLACVATKNTARVAELLTDDFLYSRHPKMGASELDKTAIIAFMPSIEESTARIVEQHMHRIGDIIVVHNVTRAHQKVAGATEVAADDGAGARSFLDKNLIDSSAWRNEGGAWRCFDYRLLDAVDA